MMPRVGVGLRGMRVVLARLCAEIAAVAVGPAIFPLKTLLARPGLDQGPVDREVLVRHQRLGALDDAAQETAGDVLIQQAVTIVVNTVGSPIGSSMSIPTNHQKSRL